MKKTWISDGEKYGLVGLEVKTEGHIPQGAMTPSLSVLTDTVFVTVHSPPSTVATVPAGMRRP